MEFIDRRTGEIVETGYKLQHPVNALRKNASKYTAKEREQYKKFLAWRNACLSQQTK